MGHLDGSTSSSVDTRPWPGPAFDVEPNSTAALHLCCYTLPPRPPRFRFADGLCVFDVYVNMYVVWERVSLWWVACVVGGERTLPCCCVRVGGWASAACQEPRVWDLKLEPELEKSLPARHPTYAPHRAAKSLLCVPHSGANDFENITRFRIQMSKCFFLFKDKIVFLD